jgi:peroxiredoxin
MRLIYITLPAGLLIAAGGVVLMVASSRATNAAGINSPSSGTNPVHPVTAEMAAEAAKEAKLTAPPLSLPDATGKQWTFSSLSNGKPVYLYFILDGCPCSTDAEPLFHELYKRYKDKITFAGVIGSDRAAAAKWAKDHEMPYTILADPKLTAVRAYNAKHSVYNVLITPDGHIDKMWPGYSQDMLREVNSHMAAVIGTPEKPFDPLYAPLKMSSGCFFPSGT